jgi:hypothetical protein
MWRLVDMRIDAAHLPKVRTARAAARAAAWAAGAAPAAGAPLYIDIDATLVIDHSDNTAKAAAAWKKSFGHHPLLAFLDRPEIAGGEALAGLLRAGNAGSNTADDHITVLDQGLASLPPQWRPDPHDGGHPAKPLHVLASMEIPGQRYTVCLLDAIGPSRVATLDELLDVNHEDCTGLLRFDHLRGTGGRARGCAGRGRSTRGDAAGVRRAVEWDHRRGRCRAVESGVEWWATASRQGIPGEL